VTIEITIDNEWNTGSNQNIAFDQVCSKVYDLSKNKAKIFIGSDSGLSKQKITFCKAICVHGEEVAGLYFFNKYKVDAKIFPSIISRITEETRLSVELAEFLITNYKIPLNKIELHIDVSPFGMNTETSKFSEMLRGYVNGAGFTCRIKPNAWASQTVADKHSK
jgi:predicted RNase H-related nuclease YkuK (DUF458 family)